MLTPVIFPYKMSSASAKLLRDALREEFPRCRMVYPDRHYRPREDHLIINWGFSGAANWFQYTRRDIPVSSQFLNKTFAVADASNKVLTLYHLPTQICPEWWTDKRDVPEDIEVFCRTLLTSRGGNGIIIAANHSELVDAPLYTKAYRVAQEYRVHCTPSSIIDVVQKKRMSSATCEERGITRDDRIRNHDNGWVFARCDIDVPLPVIDAAMSAVASLGLDFGAVDIATTTHNEKPIVVFEVNTAPGLHEGGTALQKYIQFFKEKCDGGNYGNS